MTQTRHGKKLCLLFLFVREKGGIMDFSGLAQMVTQVGFPIVMCGAMAWYVKYTTDKNREQLDKLNLQHAKEMDSVTEALQNNTLALQNLTSMLAKG